MLSLLLLLLLLLGSLGGGIEAQQSNNYTCDVSADTCLNGKCEPSLFCDSECFDCDPCAEFSNVGCGNCTAVPGCLWCDLSAICVSASIVDTLPLPTFLGCTTDDNNLVDRCENIRDDYLWPDPFYGSQKWVYDLMSVKQVWEELGYTGKGIHVRINDGGTDSNHPDLAPNFDPSLSCSHWMPSTDTDSLAYSHGTHCAAIATGAANDVCSTGIAPEATLSACRVIGTEDVVPLATAEMEDASYLLAGDINSNSWGADGCLTLSRRRLQSRECPFQQNAEPCSEESSCAGVDWDDVVLNPGNYSTCELEVVSYCQSNLERDPLAWYVIVLLLVLFFLAAVT